MAKLGPDLVGVPFDVNQTYPNTLNSITTSPPAGLGARAVQPDGRVYRFAQVGASALVAGNLLQGQTTVANHQHISPYAASGTIAAGTGTFQLQVTLGATAATAAFYTNGYLIIDSGSGDLGYTYSIVNNTSAVTSGTPVIYLGEPLVQAIKTTDTVCLVPNPYSAVIQMPTSATGVPIGVALTAATASYYCWIQTRGPSSVLSDANVAAIGDYVIPSPTTAGSVTQGTTSYFGVPVGVALVTGVSATAKPVFLQLE